MFSVKNLAFTSYTEHLILAVLFQLFLLLRPLWCTHFCLHSFLLSFVERVFFFLNMEFPIKINPKRFVS